MWLVTGFDDVEISGDDDGTVYVEHVRPPLRGSP
jgi:hypothetical protein